MLLEKGERGLLVGKTGSGKTQGGMFHLRNTEMWPIIIFDTKIEDHFFSVPEGNETMELVEGLDHFEAYAKTTKKKDMSDFILVRPTLHEYTDPDILDQYCRVVYENFGPCFFYIDEAQNLHKNGQAGANLMNILARGRSKGKTTLMGTQRPARISRSCLTESDRFFIYRLTDGRDRKTLAEVVPDYDKFTPPEKYHFHYYHTGGDEKIHLFGPVPIVEMKQGKIFSRKWL